jgi:sugar/nucleoside kinase (ribokinase family)
MYRRAKATGVVTGLDLRAARSAGAERQPIGVASCGGTLPHVDLFLPSLDELASLLRPGLDVYARTDDTLISALAEESLAMGAGVVVIKLGDRGLYVCTAPRLTFARTKAGWGASCGRRIYSGAEPLVGTTGLRHERSPGSWHGFLRGQRSKQR